jgi:uncharacterized protein with PQ loop repeat
MVAPLMSSYPELFEAHKCKRHVKLNLIFFKIVTVHFEQCTWHIYDLLQNVCEMLPHYPVLLRKVYTTGTPVYHETDDLEI